MNEFQEAIGKFGIHAGELESEEVRERIQQYCVLLWHRNLSLNLTRHTDWDRFVSRDLVDTLELSKLIDRNQEILDIGSGGGVPGLLLAILRPDLTVTLAESVGKKVAALVDFATELRIDVQICHERAEKILDDFRFDAVVARAVGTIGKLCMLLDGRWPNVGRLLAVKGPNWINEKRDAESSGLLGGLETGMASEYLTPGADWKSCIVELRAKRAAD